MVDRSAMAEMLGASLTGVTVTVKVVEVGAIPSETVTVIVAVPPALAAGVTVTVRLAPDPPKTMPLLATTA